MKPKLPPLTTPDKGLYYHVKTRKVIFSLKAISRLLKVPLCVADELMYKYIDKTGLPFLVPVYTGKKLELVTTFTLQQMGSFLKELYYDTSLSIETRNLGLLCLKNLASVCKNL